LETLALHRAHHVTVLCQGLAEEIAARGVPKQKITVIPNAVDARVFTPDRAPDPALRSAYGLTGKTVVSFIGSFYAYEGLSLLIQALPKVMAAHPSLALLLVGGGPQEAALKAQVERHHLSDRVVFAGRVSHTRIEEYYALSDLMVYPRLPMRLTELVTPIKPLEAMAQGRVVLASDVGGHKELIDHARTGWLFKAGSVEALADAMIALLKDRTRSPGVLERARRFVADTRTWEHSVARYQPVFEALVGRR
jgi:PEP-CTERM/exosortase A-associated glycosyltransferase